MQPSLSLRRQAQPRLRRPAISLLHRQLNRLRTIRRLRSLLRQHSLGQRHLRPELRRQTARSLCRRHRRKLPRAARVRGQANRVLDDV